ncbi:hypothetical protein HC251_24175 [Iamia sp. SCSIO 61187]|uniref:ADP-ribosylglycohydrolase family protein n=1 Tax=Iamia sp. SCSIO 61187 TaxID=2722752 RepID=UPI001C624A96|nr:ADP-ribosylglycohydrolase family protein [Iamia sp. SCSIO 61187]QYG95220.1 hypothetical protein HC251_24175 [Iamia sp. SCSIO 61187]
MSGPLTSVVPEAVRSDRAAGVVLASACGDALGAGYEFGPALDDSVVVEMTGGGAFGWAPGEWTDDTQMALAVLSPLAGASPDVVFAAEDGFLDWFSSQPADVGSQTRKVLSSGPPLAQAAAAIAARNRQASGNGSLMRTGPVALSHPGDPAAIARLAVEVSALTHATDDCIDACVLWCVAIDHAVHHAPPSDVAYDWAGGLRSGLELLPVVRRGVWSARIDEALGARPTDFPNNGWVVHALQAAVAAITSTPVPTDAEPCTHLQHALAAAVRAGGDTDTVAAIAGALLGARWGGTAVPLAWRRLVHGVVTYEDELCSDAIDLERRARLAYAGGRVGADHWLRTATMLPHYREVWPAEPLAVELDGVVFGNVHAMGQGAAEGCDVVVSLCRMGDDDAPPDVDHHVLGLIDSTPEENPNVRFLLHDLAAQLEVWVAEGRRPFVHCVQAQNRTPAAALAWLVLRGATADEALETVTAALNRPKPFLVEAATN